MRIVFERSRRNGARAALALTILAAGASGAHAHVGEPGGFVAGFTHPIGGLDHMLAMLAVGLWGAQLGKPQIWLLPIAFPLAMAFGGALGLMGVGLPLVEIGIAVSAVALGLMVLLEARPPVAASLALIALFAVCHGHAHGTELTHGQSALLYSIGFVIATGLLHAIGIGIGTVHRWKQGRLALRGAGAVVMLGGVFFLLSIFGWVS